VNIQVEITIVTETAGAPANRKTVSLTVADRQSGSVRSFDRNPTAQGGQLNVDVTPAIQKNGRILARVGLEYQSGSEIPMVQVRAQPLLDSGKALQISRAVSPAGDRSVTAEVTATVLK